jgi:peptidoglycan/LPS O-acetylase OafA/YrhL
MGFAIGVFVVALGIIASEKLHRTTIALAGAVLIVATQTIEQQQAIESIDFNTIGLLAGMMLIASREPTSSARSPNGWADTGRFAARCDGVTEETR